MKNTAGEQYGIDEAEIARLLDVFSITAEDEKQVASLQPILSKRAEQVTDAFYEYLFRFQELGPLISGEGRLSRLRRAFVRYIATLGQEVRNTDYFEGRSRIGRVHDAIGISPKRYLAAQSATQQELRKILRAEIGDSDRAENLMMSLDKFLWLDAALAVESYHRARLERIEGLLSDLKEEEEKVQGLARTDQLTGLANRAFFLERLESECDRCRRYGHSLCLLLLDVDDFKAVNDLHGHQMGDEVLRAIGEIIRTQVRSTELVGRIGGEELAVAFPKTALDKAKAAAERIRLGILEREFRTGSGTLTVTVSGGLAESNDEIRDADEMRRMADKALYDAKTGGKNCIRISS